MSLNPLTIRSLLHLCVAVVIALVCGSCNEEEPTGPTKIDPIDFVQPAVGSSFTYETVEIDTLTQLEIDSTRKIEIIHITAVGLEYEGRNNVTELTTERGSVGTLSYCSYDADGTVWNQLNNYLRGRNTWVRLPTVGDAKSEASLADAARVNTGPNEYKDLSTTVSSSYERIGTGEETVQSTVFATIKFKQKYSSKTSENGYSMGSYSASSETTFAPKLGMMVSTVGSGKGYNAYGKVDYTVTSRTKLLSYVLR